MTTSVGTQLKIKAVNPNGEVVYLSITFVNSHFRGYEIVTQFEGKTNYVSRPIHSQIEAERRFYSKVKPGATIKEL